MEIIAFNDFMHNTYKSKNKYLRNKRLKQLSIFILASCLYSENVYAANIDIAGNKILGICRNIGYWMCLIMASIEIIKSLMQGNTKGITSIIAKYAIGYGSLFLMPWLFDLIRDLFA